MLTSWMLIGWQVLLLALRKFYIFNLPATCKWIWITTCSTDKQIYCDWYKHNSDINRIIHINWVITYFVQSCVFTVKFSKCLNLVCEIFNCYCHNFLKITPSVIVCNYAYQETDSLHCLFTSHFEILCFFYWFSWQKTDYINRTDYLMSRWEQYKWEERMQHLLLEHTL